MSDRANPHLYIFDVILFYPMYKTISSYKYFPFPFLFALSTVKKCFIVFFDSLTLGQIKSLNSVKIMALTLSSISLIHFEDSR